MEIRDRNYIQDKNGNYLKIIGDHHPEDKIVSYIKYFPLNLGDRKINGSSYGYNSFVSKSFVILQEDPARTFFSESHGGVITCTPIDKVEKIYSCREKLQYILKNKNKYKNHRVGKELVDFLDKIKNSVQLENVGITGSFLIDCYTDSSDIDLVCYGEETTHTLWDIFHSDKVIDRYQGEWAKTLFKRRMIHLAPMDFGLLIKQENRKLQGLTKQNHVHINCQPLRSDDDKFFEDVRMQEVGEISCTVEITNHTQGIFAPAFYEIEVIDIIDSLFSDSGNFKGKIKALISHIGAYSSCFYAGDRLFVHGKLVQITKNDEVFYGIELSPWNTSRNYSASLLR